MKPFQATRQFCLLACLCVIFSSTEAQEVHEYMDLQIHTTMHIPYGFFGEGLQYFDENDPPKLKYKHRFKNVNYANFFENNPGVRIFVNGTILPELIASKKRARRLVLEQIQFVNDFVAVHSDKFAVAKSPEEVRSLVHETDKTIFIHSIEGAKRLIHSREDAHFWAEQGVAYVTLLHLVDNEYGAAGIKPGALSTMINFKGTFKKIFGAAKKRGLKEKGRNAIRWLAEAGVMIDITHMSEQTRRDALDFMEEHNIPPISTHDLFQPIQNHVRGVSKEDVIKIYQNGGFMALPLSGLVLRPHKAETAIQDSIQNLEKYCPGSIDDFKFTYLAVQDLLRDSFATILTDKSKNFEQLTAMEKIQLSVGFQSDFNGWLNHSRPRYGEKGCYAEEPPNDLEIERNGLLHPGLVKEHWQLLAAEGVDLAPIKRASEKFLQLWQFFLDHKKEL